MNPPIPQMLARWGELLLEDLQKLRDRGVPLTPRIESAGFYSCREGQLELYAFYDEDQEDKVIVSLTLHSPFMRPGGNDECLIERPCSTAEFPEAWRWAASEEALLKILEKLGVKTG